MCLGDFNLCRERERERKRDTPHLFCVYKYKGMERGIEAKGKDIMGLKETKLLGLGDSCCRRDGTGLKQIF